MWTSWKSNRNRLFLLIVWFGTATPCEASARQFVSIKQSGLIWVMPPLASDWQKLRDNEIAEGSLLRLMPESSIELKQIGSQLTAAEIEARIRIAEPLILRLDRNIFKNLRYRDYVIDGIWNEGATDEKEATSSPLLSFAAAYVRHFLALETAQELPKLKTDPQKATIEAGEKINNLSLLSPQQDSLHFIDPKRVEIPIYWESPQDDLEFKIYLWASDNVKREALASVKGHRYLLTINQVGRYRLQISSSDYRYRSEVLRLEVDRPQAAIPNEEPLRKQFEKANIDLSTSLTIQYPPANFQIMASDLKVECLFRWLDKNGLKAGDEYKLIVQSEKNGDVFKVSTQQNFATLRLPPGKFQYFVMKQNKITSVRTIASRSQSLQVSNRTDASSWKQLGRKIHEAQHDEIVLIESP